ncbi:MAG: AAA family ATPase, partial [Syntrophales bacterium]|nr:AAA family ATPase [Syntrophales bacterium]
VKRFREINKWTSLDGESTYLNSQINRLQSMHDQDQLVSQKISSALRLLDEAEHAPLTSKTSFYFDEAPPPYKALNDRLVNLMLERDTLLLTYTNDFPQVRALKNQIHENIESMKSYLKAQRRNLASNIGIYRRQLADLNMRFKRLPEKALELTRLDRDVGITREVYTMLEKRYQEALIAEAEKLEEVKIVRPAIEPTVPVNPPKIGTNTVLGTVLGLILGLVFAFLIETFDTSIGAIEEVEEFLGVHVMGVIPFVSTEEIKTLLGDDPNVVLDDDRIRRYARLAAHFVPSSTLSESYKALRTSLNFICSENNLKTVLFTSSSPGEGKTSIVVNVAITMAQIGQKVLLIDGDLRRPVISKLFGIEQIPGITDVILGNYEWHKVIRSITDLMMGKMSIEDIMKTPGMDNLHIITSGTYAPNPAEILTSKAIGEFLSKVKEEYDVILIDAPPVLAATDAALWSSRVDGTAMVYQVGKIARGALKRSKVSLENLKANVVGVILNGLKAEISPDFGYQDYYYYYYGREKTPLTLSQRIKAKILTGPLSIWYSFGRMFGKKQPVEGFGSQEVADKEQQAAMPAKIDKVEVEETISRKKEEHSKEKSRSWFKIFLVSLLLILAALGVLYQMGFIEMQNFKKMFFGGAAFKEIVPVTTKRAESVKSEAVPPIVQEQAVSKPADNLPDTNKPYSIQVRALPATDDARQFVDALKAKGEDAFFVTVNLKGRGQWNRLFIGRFATEDAAAQYLKKNGMGTKYPGCIVRNTADDSE